MPNPRRSEFSTISRWHSALGLALITCALLVPYGSAEDSSPGTLNYVRTVFTLEDGLPGNTINTITQTRNGLLWVGTGSGLASFDGRTFTRVDLRIPGGSPPSSITSLVEGAEGDLWVGSDAGIVRIPKSDLNDPYLGASTAYRLGKEKSDEVDVIFRASDGGIWAGTNHGLYRLDGRRFVSVLESIDVTRIKQARNGRLLLIVGGRGLAEYDGSSTVNYLTVGAQLGVPDNEIFDVFEDSAGTRWYCTNAGVRAIGVHGFRHLEPDKPAFAAAHREVDGPNGKQWVSTGVGVYAIVGGQLVAPTPNATPRAFYAAKQGDLWIGTNGTGLVHLQRRLVQMYTQAEGMMNDIAMTILPTQDGKLWVGNNCGLEMFDGKSFKHFAEKDGLVNSCVWSLAEDHKGDLWIGTYGGGLFQYHNGVFKQFTREQGLAGRIAVKVITARDGALWIATPDGLSHMSNGVIRNYSTADGLSSNQVLDVHQDREGTLWVATQGGVDRLIADRFVSVPASQASEAVLAHSFVEDASGNLYTTDLPSGISRVIGGQLVYENIPLKLMNMVESPDHSLWFSGHSGIIRIPEHDLAQYKDSKMPLDYQQFGRSDGLNSIQSSAGSPNIAITSDGKVWVATVGGLAMIDTKQLSTIASKPNIFVTSATTDGTRSRIGDRLVLPPGLHRVEMTLAVVDLATPEKVRLQYRLEGVDTNWLDGNASRTIVYTNVPPGSHLLYVRSTDTIGHWDEERVVYELIQQPYLYQTKLFQLATLTLAVLLFVLVYRWRIDQVVMQTRRILAVRQIEREAIARDLHDTFLQGVQALMFKFAVANKKLAVDDPVRPIMEATLVQSDQVLLEGRKLISNLHAETLSTHGLLESLRVIGEDLQELYPATQLIVETHEAERELNTVISQDLHTICREALTNAFQHAEATHVWLILSYAEASFKLEVRDDGRGIENEVLLMGFRSGHWGLRNMQERSERLGGRYVLKSSPESGTTIEIVVPGVLAYAKAPGNLRARLKALLR